MKILLDTHAFIWYAQNDERLPEELRKQILLQDNETCISIVSLWEIAIKSRLGKLTLFKPLKDTVNEILEHGIKIIPVYPEHIYLINTLPLHHRDPFDRMIIAQCITDNLTIASIDKNFPLYPVSIIWN